MTYKSFFEQIFFLKGISKIWIKILDMFKTVKPGISDESLNVFCIYFSLLDDGNICIALNKNKLLEKWMKKWNGLLLINQEQISDEMNNFLMKEEDFKKIIEQGLIAFQNDELSELVSRENGDCPAETKPFVISKIYDTDWLFAEKYFNAKKIIEQRVKDIFKTSENQNIDLCKLDSDFRKLNKNCPEFKLKEKQLSAIGRGLSENLIITGGPGTGKTTVIFYLLWKLFENPENLKRRLYLAAPSGKAADRMKESIRDALKRIDVNENLEIYEKLNSVDSYTIHRLLSYSPKDNVFKYSSKNQFNDDSIFVIDEASMVDIDLFRALVEAIPDNARVFILGDKDQLPSVQAGAVLGELLDKKSDSVLELVESNRFASNSDLGALKDAVQKKEISLEGNCKFKKWSDWHLANDFKDKSDKNNYPVSFIELDNKNKAKQIDEIVRAWSDEFYKDIVEICFSSESNLRKSCVDENITRLNDIWKKSMRAKILSAERQGIKGVEIINDCICNYLKEIKGIEPEKKYFPGQVLMINQNQKMYNLYNGDCGVVVQFENDSFNYLMLEKTDFDDSANLSELNGNRIFRLKNFIFYPLYLLPEGTFEVAYAITIHKAQGSGYKNILIFLPDQKGHPLLNKQILYTAITRSSGSTYIVSNLAMLNCAKETKIERDTMIDL